MEKYLYISEKKNGRKKDMPLTLSKFYLNMDFAN